MRRKLILKKWLFSALCLFLFSSCQKPKISAIISQPENQTITAYQNFSRNSLQNFIIEDSLKLISSEDILGLPFSSYLLYSGELIFTTHNGYLYFVSLDDFDNQRKISLADGIGTTPSIHGNTLYIAVNKGSEGLIAYNMETAKNNWEIDGMLSQSSPIIVENHIIHATLNGQIQAYNHLDGTRVWQVELNDAILNNLSSVENTLVVAGQNGLINCYRSDNGQLNWSHQITDAIYASPVLDNDFAFISTYSGSIIKIGLQVGEIINRYEANVEVFQTPAMDAKTIYIALANGKLIALDKAIDTIKWQVQLNGPISATPLLGTRELIVGTESGKLYRINKQNGHILQILKLGGRPRIQPIFYDNKLYLSYTPDYLEVYSTNGRVDE